jgi:hypothetical protein
MPELKIPGDSPQFGTAEYSGAPAGDICKACGQPVTGVYYRANNSAMLCGSCADRVQREVPKDSHAAFVRALLFGLGGFFAAFVAYSAIGILFRGWTIGYLALGVGWIVGKAMMAGSGGIGGRRYQIVAVLLTYAAVSMSAVPIALFLPHEQAQSQKANHASQSPPEAAPATGEPDQNSPQSEEPTKPRTTHRSLVAALGLLALLGLASPFLGGVGGLIMLVILFVGMQFAWRITRGHPKIVVDGPFQISSSAKA